MEIIAINEITENGEKNVAVAIKYEKPVKLDGLTRESFTVTNRTIEYIYVNDKPISGSKKNAGPYVILELDYTGSDALTIREHADRSIPDYDVLQVEDIIYQDGLICGKWETPAKVSCMRNELFDRFAPGIFTDEENGLTMMYQLYMPENYEPEKNYPLILYWHGGGEKGVDNEKPLLTSLCGSIWASDTEQKKHPSFILVPQCVPNGDWIDPDTYVITEALETGWRLMFRILDQYSIDVERIYCTGFSMGGMAAWESTITYRDLFAATMIYAGQDSYEGIEQLKDHNIWVFHPEDDDKAMSGNAEIMDTLKAAGAKISKAVWDGALRGEGAVSLAKQQILEGTNILYTQFLEGSIKEPWVHVAGWRPACTNTEVRNWLFAQNRNDSSFQRYNNVISAEYLPVEIDLGVNGGNIKQIAAGSRHNVMMLDDGQVYAWGFNGTGQCGNISPEGCMSFCKPVQVEGLEEIIQVAAGNNFSMALTKKGDVYAWGSNSCGQLGQEDQTRCILVPEKVSGATNIIEIRAGDNYALALKNNGTVWAWGANVNGQLGNGNFRHSAVPVKVRDEEDASGYLAKVVSIEAGVRMAAAVKEDGTICCWGDGEYGQLGKGFAKHGPGTNLPFYSRDKTDATGYLTNAKKVSSGRCFTVVLKNDGNLYLWGLNKHGELGIGEQKPDTDPHRESDFDTTIVDPVRLKEPEDIIDVQAGMNHTVILKRDGSVWTWGFNQKMSEGVLGLADILCSYEPVKLELEHVDRIFVGQNHNFAITQDGAVWGWGNSNYDRLGNDLGNRKFLEKKTM